MKKKVIYGLFVLVLITISMTFAGSGWAQNMEQQSYTMKKMAYGAEIDSKTAFYQKRLYLVDSEYAILAEIGKDAVQKIRFLTAYRKHIVNNMLASNIPLKKTRMSSFIGLKMCNIQASMEAYSSE